MTKKTEIKVGDTVKFNRLADAVLFKVVARDGFVLDVVPVTPPGSSAKSHATQRIDVSFAIRAYPKRTI